MISALIAGQRWTVILMSDNNIFRHETCAVCGKVAYCKYIGTKDFDGGYTRVNQFEPSHFEYVRIGNSSFMACPDCLSEIQNLVFNLIDSKKTYKTNL